MDVLDLVNDTNQVGPGHDFMVRPFVCKFSGCDRAFARKSDLARHFRIHTNERPFTCMYRGCGKAFIQRSALTVHTRVHTGERPHHCETCNKAFADSSSLARHRRIHTGKRPYGCKVPGCGRQFARRNTYLKHFKRQHPELPPPTSNSVRALHIPAYGGRPQSFLVSGAGHASGSETPDYDGTPPLTGPPHGFAASHPSEGSAYFGGGYVNGQLHSSQLAALTNSGLRPYFHPGHAEAQGQHGSALGDPNNGGEGPQGDHSPSELHHQSNIPYNGDNSSQSHSSIGAQDYSADQSVFSYQDNAIPRVANGLMNPGNGFYFKTDVSSIMPQTQPWGGVGGGFAPGQLTLPGAAVHSPYYQVAQNGQKVDNKLGNRLQSPLSERAASPDLVDINNAQTMKMPTIHHPPYPMPFTNMDNNLNSSLSAAAMSALHPSSGQLHSAPPHMQRFHSAPGVPTMNNQHWTQPEPFKPSTPGFESRPHLMRRHASDWAPEHAGLLRANSEAEAESKEGTPAPTNQWHTAYAGGPGTRPVPYRFSSSTSNGSNASPLLNVSTPQSLPPLSIFPNPSGINNAMMPGGFGYPPNSVNPWLHNSLKDQQVVTPVLGRPMFGTPQQADEMEEPQITLNSGPKLPIARDRQTSGVSVIGAGLGSVTFGDREGSAEVDRKWTPSDTASVDGNDDGDSEDDEDVEDDDSDDDFVLGKTPIKRKTSNGKRARGGMASRGTAPKRRVLT